MENERADAGRDCRTYLARRNSQVRTGTGEKYFPCSADHEQDCRPYSVDAQYAELDDRTCKSVAVLFKKRCTECQ